MSTVRDVRILTATDALKDTWGFITYSDREDIATLIVDALFPDETDSM